MWCKHCRFKAVGQLQKSIENNTHITIWIHIKCLTGKIFNNKSSVAQQDTKLQSSCGIVAYIFPASFCLPNDKERALMQFRPLNEDTGRHLQWLCPVGVTACLLTCLTDKILLQQDQQQTLCLLSHWTLESVWLIMLDREVCVSSLALSKHCLNPTQTQHWIVLSNLMFPGKLFPIQYFHDFTVVFFMGLLWQWSSFAKEANK